MSMKVRTSVMILVAVVFWMGMASRAQAAVTTNTWNGGGADGNWTTGGNWGGTAPSTAAGVTNALVFGGTSQLSMNNDYTSFLAGLGISANNTGVTFANDNTSGKTGQFTLSGNKLLLGGNIQSTQVNSGSLTDTIALDMQIKGGTRVITAAKNHSIEVSGVISEDAGGKVLTTTGNSDNSGKVKLSGLNTFTGDMKLNGGTTVMNTLANTNVASSAGKGSVIWIGAGTVDTTLEYTGAATSTDRKILLGIDSGTQNSGSRIDNNGSGTLSFTRATFNDTLLSVGGARTLTLGGANNGVIQGIIQDNSPTGAIALVKADAGTWTLTGANTFSGTTTISNGVIAVGGNLALSTNLVTLAGGGLAGASGGGTLTNTINLKNSASFDTSNGNLTMVGAITNSSALTKTGAGTLTLAATNTYTGATTVNSGTLVVNGATTNSAITVASSAVLCGVGSVGTVTINSNATLSAGDTSAVGTLTATNLTLAEGAKLVWNYSGGSGNLVTVNGAVSVPTNATVTVTGSGALPSSRVLFSGTSMTGATDLTGWIVTGSGLKPNMRAVRSGNEVKLVVPTGFILNFY